jgi:hypothetical protein
LKAPATGGHHRVVVTTAGGETAADLVVSPDAATIAADPERLETWTSAHGGRVVPLSTIADPRDGLAATLDAVVTPGTRPVLWRPMRSAWWIVPFALALGADWWLRRRARHLTLDLSSL